MEILGTGDAVKNEIPWCEPATELRLLWLMDNTDAPIMRVRKAWIATDGRTFIEVLEEWLPHLHKYGPVL